MLSYEDNDLLCRVGPGTAMGALIRRYWFPAMLSVDLPANGAPPRALRLLGEDLVVFRDDDGRLGVLDGYCPHRGVRLSLARNEGCGLRCIYHGWVMDVEGNVVETPAEPEVSRFARRVVTTSYRFREAGGLLWVFMGPESEMPPFPDFEWTALPLDHLVHAQVVARANYAQLLEGTIDSSHVAVLHADNIASGKQQGIDTKTPLDEEHRSVRPSTDPRPRLDVEQTAYGFHYAALHRPTDARSGDLWARVTQFVAPFYSYIPGEIFTAFVPIDDYTTIFFAVSYDRDAPVTSEVRLQRAAHFGVRTGVDLAGDYTLLNRSRENNWNQDREAMARGETFSGVFGVSAEDVVVQEAQGRIEGRIADRSREHLGAQDIAIRTMRQLLLDSARTVAGGGAPRSDPKVLDYSQIRAVMGMLGEGERWQEMDTSGLTVS